MNLLQRIKLLLKSRGAIPFQGTKHVIKPAFTCGGIDYFEFDTTVANLPFKRGLKFLSIYNEMDMRCDRFYLEAFCDAIESQFNKPKGITFAEMSNIRNWALQTKERLTWVYHEDLVYKLASVVFFDANENPDDWEWGYAAKKIEHWKKNSPDSFFLHMPIQRLIPFLGDAALNFQTYSLVQMKKDKAQLENLLANTLDKKKKDLPNFTQRYFSEEMKQS